MSIYKNNFLNKLHNQWLSLFRHGLLPPAQCVLCGGDGRQGICDACQLALPWLDIALCPRCAMPSNNAQICAECHHNPPAFTHTLAAFAYQTHVAKLVPAGKFGERWSLFALLAQISASHYRIGSRPDCLVPMPLHASRLRERGFNQSMEIAQVWQRELGVPVQPDLLQRIRDTSHQTQLDVAARARNMRRAFQASPNARGLHIVLVDDVMTSGATLHVAARTLLQAGARQVDAWVLARTL